MPRKCKSNPNNFCYVCGSFTPLKKSKKLTANIKSSYEMYFGLAVKNQDKSWVPHVLCVTCAKYLLEWANGKRQLLPFGVPMRWTEPRNHDSDCYFCINKTTGYNSRNKGSIKYIETPSAQRPLPHDENHPVPPSCTIFETESSTTDEEYIVTEMEDPEFRASTSEGPHLITQGELNDLVRDLNLSKSQAELLGSRLQQWNLLAKETRISVYRRRHDNLVDFYSVAGNLTYCTNVPALFEALGMEHNAEEWRLFIDSSKTSLKAVLLHIGNKYPSVPIAYAVSMKESYDNLKVLLQNINYQDHSWKICADFKVIAVLMGMQLGYTKYCCFLCLWDSRDRENHYIRRHWPPRETFQPGIGNILHPALVDKTKIILPPLHIKLGLMKNFVKSLNFEGDAFRYLREKFPKLSEAKIKEGIFVGPQIRELENDSIFLQKLNSEEKSAWTSMIAVFRNFLGNHKHDNYKEVVENMLQNFHVVGCKMSLKIHMLHSHLDSFEENLGAVSDEHGERFHQDISGMEKRYQGKWNPTMLADYCWTLKRESVNIIYKRKTNVHKYFHP